MDKFRIKEMANNPNFISGIYNYCDRWCERCPFTSRCFNYALSEEHYDSPESRDVQNKLFWEKLHETFQTTFELIREMADKHGIDLDSMDMSESVKEEEDNFEKASSHIYSLLGQKYSSEAAEWFENAENIFKTKAEEIELKLKLDLPNEDPLYEVNQIKNAVEVIQWYQYQISIKTIRALHSKMDKFEESDDYPKDSDGSAKIALIEIDRSISAWGELYCYFGETEQEDKILYFILMLEKLRRGLEKEFPEARAFKRPGFDEINLN